MRNDKKGILWEVTKMPRIIQMASIILVIAALSITASAATYKYDDLGRLKEVTYSSGQKIEYTYDARGNILSVKDLSAIKLNPIGNKTVFVGKELKFTVTAVGQEGSILEYSASNLPEGAVFNAQTGGYHNSEKQSYKR